MVEAYVEAEIEGLGKIVRVDAPFDESLVALRDRGIEYPISSRDLAFARVHSDRNRSLNNWGSYTSAGFIYAEKANPLLALNSPLNDIELARKAMQANREGRYFSTESIELYERYLAIAQADKDKKPEERAVLILPRKGFKISSEENPGIFRGIFKDVAESYLEFMGFNDLDVYLINTKKIDSTKGTTLTQLWLRRFVERSIVSGSNKGLDYGDGLRGCL